MRITSWLLLVGALWGAAIPAFAQPPEVESEAIAEARIRFEEAEELYHSGDFALALRGFEQAYQLLQAEDHPNAILVVYNIALTNERLERDRAALEAYEMFLAGASADTPNRADADVRARELRLRLRLRAEDAVAESTPRSSGSGGGVSIPSVVVASTGVAVAIAGGVLGGVALMDSESARTGCAETRCPESARAGIEGAQTLANVSDGLLFGGLAVAATGVILLFVLDGGGDTSASAACDGDGCVAVVRGRF